MRDSDLFFDLFLDLTEGTLPIDNLAPPSVSRVVSVPSMEFQPLTSGEPELATNEEVGQVVRLYWAAKGRGL